MHRYGSSATLCHFASRAAAPLSPSSLRREQTMNNDYNVCNFGRGQLLQRKPYHTTVKVSPALLKIIQDNSPTLSKDSRAAVRLRDFRIFTSVADEKGSDDESQISSDSPAFGFFSGIDGWLRLCL